MLEIHIHGRPGQGVQLAGQLLAAAFQRAGDWAQIALGCDGGCQGALASAVVQVDRAPIDPGHEPAIPDHLVVLDPALLAELSCSSVHHRGLVVANAPSSPCHRAPGEAHVIAVNAAVIADRTGLGPVVGTAVLGALAAVTGIVPIDHLLAAVREDSPTTPGSHARACEEGYQEARALVETLR